MCVCIPDVYDYITGMSNSLIIHGYGEHTYNTYDTPPSPPTNITTHSIGSGIYQLGLYAAVAHIPIYRLHHV